MATVTVTPTYEPTTGSLPPRVRLNIADTGSPAVTSVTVTRLDPDGRLVPVRTPTGDPLPLSGAAALIYDYEAPFQAPVYYSTLESPTVVSAAVTVDEDRIWLIHPGVPPLSRPIELAAGSHMEETWDVQQGVFWPMGRETPIVHTDGQRKAPASSITVATETAQEKRDIKALLWDAGTVLLNVPTSLGLDLDTAYIAVAAVSLRRLSDIGSMSERNLVLPYQVVRRPAGGSQATRTYTDLLIDFASYADVQANYPTYFAVLAGP